MLVVVVLVGGVPVPVVDVVHVTVVRHRHMTATLAVPVVMGFVRGVPSGLALVVVSVVDAVQMAVVDEVDVVSVRDGHVTAAIAMGVVVAVVFGVDSHCFARIRLLI